MSLGHSYANAGGRRGALIGGLGGVAAGAAMGGLPKKHPHTGEEFTKKQRVGRAVAGGLSMGVFGAATGHDVGWSSRAKKWNAGFRPTSGPGAPPAPVMPDWLKGSKTKAEGRRAFHAQARKLHPDLGGNADEFKRVSAEWEAHEPHFKTAMYNAFADELEKIAGLGAMLGGVAGWKLSPKSTKGKVYGTLIGAGVGHLAGKGLSTAKREIVDRPEEYERSQLYGYVSPPPQNF